MGQIAGFELQRMHLKQAKKDCLSPLRVEILQLHRTKKQYCLRKFNTRII